MVFTPWYKWNTEQHVVVLKQHGKQDFQDEFSRDRYSIALVSDNGDKMGAHQLMLGADQGMKQTKQDHAVCPPP